MMIPNSQVYNLKNEQDFIKSVLCNKELSMSPLADPIFIRSYNPEHLSICSKESQDTFLESEWCCTGLDRVVKIDVIIRLDRGLSDWTGGYCTYRYVSIKMLYREV